MGFAVNAIRTINSNRALQKKKNIFLTDKALKVKTKPQRLSLSAKQLDRVHHSQQVRSKKLCVLALVFVVVVLVVFVGM